LDVLDVDDEEGGMVGVVVGVTVDEPDEVELFSPLQSPSAILQVLNAHWASDEHVAWKLPHEGMSMKLDA
jgi:hypothetical protein